MLVPGRGARADKKTGTASCGGVKIIDCFPGFSASCICGIGLPPPYFVQWLYYNCPGHVNLNSRFSCLNKQTGNWIRYTNSNVIRTAAVTKKPTGRCWIFAGGAAVHYRCAIWHGPDVCEHLASVSMKPKPVAGRRVPWNRTTVLLMSCGKWLPPASPGSRLSSPGYF